MADEIYWLPTYLSRENPDFEILSPKELTIHIAETSSVHTVTMNDYLWERIKAFRNAGSLVLVMGAGDVDAWIRSKLKA